MNINNKQIKKLIDIINYLNNITRLIISKEINCSKTLINDIDTLSALCNFAQRTYETILGCSLIKNKIKNKFRSPRAEISHTTDTLKGIDCLKGFDEIEPSYLWETHFGPSGHLNKARETIKNIRETNTMVHIEINNQSASSLKPPLELLSGTDFSHYKVINKITDSLTKGIIYLIGLLYLLSTHSAPPTKKELFSLVSKLTLLDNQALNSLAIKLKEEGIIQESADMNYFFIINNAIGKNTAREFIETVDLCYIMSFLEKTNE